MANSRRRKINYTPRMTDMQAYDLLPGAIRRELQEGVQDWDSCAILRRLRKGVKNGEPETKAVRDWVDALRAAARKEIDRPVAWVGRSRKLKSPHQQANATQQPSRGPYLAHAILAATPIPTTTSPEGQIGLDL